MNTLNDTLRAERAAGTLSIGEHLRALGAIQAGDEERILAEQKRSGLPFGEVAVRLGLIDKSRLVQALARQHDFDWPLPSSSVAPAVYTALRSSDPVAEPFRDLRTRLMNHWRAQGATVGAQALAVVSAERGDGRSFVAANLAVTLAQAGLRTLLVDLDFRQPRLHEWFHRDRRQGVTGLLIGRNVLDELLADGPHRLLSLLGAGPPPPNPQELLGPGMLGLLMATLRARFDVIVADTPAWAQASDAQWIAAQCGQAVLVNRPDRGTVAAAKSLVQNLRDSGVDMVGAVVNRR